MDMMEVDDAPATRGTKRRADMDEPPGLEEELRGSPDVVRQLVYNSRTMTTIRAALVWKEREERMRQLARVVYEAEAKALRSAQYKHCT
jgi:hypothetical protein